MNFMITFTVVIMPRNRPINTRIPRTAPNRPRELTAITPVWITELYATAMALNTVPKTVRSAATASLTKPSTASWSDAFCQAGQLFQHSGPQL